MMQPIPYLSGPRGGSVTLANIFSTMGGEDTVTAFATGGQASATQMLATVANHRISICATAGDSVKLPAATVGASHYVRNDGAASMQVFGQATETINGVASATGVSHGVGMGVYYDCTTAGQWTTTPVTRVVTADGTLAAPAYTTSIAANAGWFSPGAGVWTFSGANIDALSLISTGIRLTSTKTVGWASGASASTAIDTAMGRIAAGSAGMTTGRWSGLQGAAVASANDLTLGNDGNRFQISGTTTINRILNTGWQGGSIITLHFQGSLTVTNGVASGSNFQLINLAGAANFSATANDQLTLQYDSTAAQWFEIARTVI